jgi:phosphate uptake regulator
MNTKVETRKVQISGTRTYMVSLPKNWVELVGIKNGESLLLQAQPDGTLSIRPSGKAIEAPPKKKCSIELDDPEKLVREFIGAYLGGYNLIEIKAKGNLSLKMKQFIRRISHNMIGLEIMDESPCSITLQDFLNASDLSPKKGIRRMHLITRSMFQDAIKSLKEKDADLSTEIVSRDDDIDRLYWLIAKQYNLLLKNPTYTQQIGVMPLEGLYYLLIGRIIERVGDHTVNFARYSEILSKEASLDESTIAQVVSFAERVGNIFDQAINAFQANEPERANQTISEANQLLKLKDELIKNILHLKTRAIITVSLAYIIESIERICSYATDIGEITIDRKMVI